jgi:hypothetical protein
MNLDPIRNAATEVTSLFSSLLQSMPDTAGIWSDQGVDGGSDLLAPALAGAAAGITVALMLALYFQTGYRSYRDMIRHGLAAAIALALMAFVISDMSNAALAYLVKTSRQPATDFELRWQQTTERAKTLADEMNRRLPEARSLPEARKRLVSSPATSVRRG